MTRNAGYRGLRPSSNRRLLLSRFQDVKHPGFLKWDGTGARADWGMFANDQFGDCGPAALFHCFMAQAQNIAPEQLDAKVLPFYFGYGKAQGETGDEPDQGVDNNSMLAYAYKQGLIQAYGQIPIAELDWYAAQFGGAIIGTMLDDDAEDDFDDAIAWGQDGDEPDPNDGHDVLLISTDGTGGGRFVTWGALQSFTPRFRRLNITDAWVVLDQKLAARAGVDFASLKAALAEIHGVCP